MTSENSHRRRRCAAKEDVIDIAERRPLSRSCTASAGGQLILMSAISPRGRCKSPIGSGSSPVTELERGYHALSMSPPRARARVIPHRVGAAASARRAVHDRWIAETASSGLGRSENVGYSTGFPEASSEATYSGASGWENRFGLSMWCPYE